VKLLEAADALERGKRRNPYLDLAGFGTRFQDAALKRRLDQTLRKAGLD
jgi:adenylate cyclase